MNISIEKVVNDTLNGFETDSGIIMGIQPEYRKTLEVLLIHTIKAWEKIKLLEEKCK